MFFLSAVPYVTMVLSYDYKIPYNLKILNSERINCSKMACGKDYNDD
jgi:hypothetical protein